MKLKIRKKWFDKIRSGEKVLELRDAHITFICEETDETLMASVESADIVSRNEAKRILENPADFDDMFKDEHQIRFRIRKAESP